MTEAEEIVEAMRQIGFFPAEAKDGPVTFRAFVATGMGGRRCTERRAVGPCFYVSKDRGAGGYWPRRADGIPKWWSDRVIFEADLEGDGGYIEGTMQEVFEWASGGGGCSTTHTILASRQPVARDWCEAVNDFLQRRLSKPEGMVVADQLEYEGLIANRDVATWPPAAVRRFWLATNAPSDGPAKRNPKRRLMR